MRLTTAITGPRRKILHLKNRGFAAPVHRLLSRVMCKGCQPRTAASIAAMSIFCIVIIASNTRLATA